MKFLENENLAQLTVKLTDATIGTGDRVINGRIEAFTMKRAGTDKKYAFALGEKYQHEIKEEENEIAEFQKNMAKCRSDSVTSVGSTGNSKRRERRLHTPKSPTNKRVRIDLRKRSNSVGALPLVKPEKRRDRSASIHAPVSVLKKSSFNTRRSRSESFDYNSFGGTPSSYTYFQSPLGDFHESCTQRLMTDLILTLNASFPDYDFSSVRPAHFARIPSSSIAMNRVNEKLSELAATSTQGGSFLPSLWSGIDEVIHFSDSEVYSYVPPNKDDDDDPLGFLTQTLDSSDHEHVVPLWSFNFFFVNKSQKRIVLFTCVQTMRNDIQTQSLDEDDPCYVPRDESEYKAGNKFVDGGIFDYYTSADDEEESPQDFDMDGVGQANCPAPPQITLA